MSHQLILVKLKVLIFIRKRNSYFTCIHGEVIFIIKKKSGQYQEIRAKAETPVLIFIPKNVPVAHVNTSNSVSRVLTLTDVSWKPNDDEMKNITFDDYNWKKWKEVLKLKWFIQQIIIRLNRNLHTAR